MTNIYVLHSLPQKYEPGVRRRRNVDLPAYNITKTFSLKRKLSVFSPEDVVFKSQYNQYAVNSPQDSEEFVSVGLFSKYDGNQNDDVYQSRDCNLKVRSI
jgi:hypothetical protein